MKKSEKEKGQDKAKAQKKQIMMILGGALAALVVITLAGYLFFNSPGAKTGNTVSVYYTGMLDDGTVFDSNVNSTPLVFTIGQGKIFKGFEEGVIGMTPGTTKTVHIPVDKAYGPYNDQLVHVVNRSTLPEGVDFKVGERYSIRRSSDGAVALVKVIGMNESSVTWDENHELAGKDLTLTITLEKIVQ
jgi:peptidylprolyl isomerase